MPNLIDQLISNAVGPIASANTPDVQALNTGGYTQGATRDVGLDGSPDPTNPIAAVAQTAGSDRYISDASAIRSTDQVAGDMANSAIQSVFTTPVEIANLPISAASPNAGSAVTRFIQRGIENATEKESYGLNARRRAYGARNNVTSDLHKAQEEQDQKDGSSAFVAGLKRVGRDVLSSVTNQDGTMLSDTVANAFGSMVTAGPIGKAVGLGGRIAEGIAMPIAVGLQEAGGAHQQTADQVLNTSHADLMANSPSYREMIHNGVDPEEARNTVARNAGLTAAAVQGPIAAAVGKVTGAAEFEAHPFTAVAPRSATRGLISGRIAQALGNVAREGVEEGVQSGTGQLAQNYGLKEANEHQDMLDGVGEQIGQGIMGAVGSAGVSQAPSAIVGSTAGAVKAAFNKAVGALDKRGSAAIAAEDAASPVSAQNMTAAQDTAAAAIIDPEVNQTLTDAVDKITDPAKKQAALDYIDQIKSRIELSPEDKQSAFPAIQTALEGATDKFDALRRVSAVATDPKASEIDRLTAGLHILDTIQKDHATFDSINDEALEHLPEGHEAHGLLNNFRQVIENVRTHPEIRQAIQDAQAFKMEAQQVNIDSPSAHQSIHNAVGIATHMPDNSNPAIIQKILDAHDNGNIKLTQRQRKTLQTAALIGAITEHQTQEAEKLGLKSTRVTAEIRNNEAEGKKGLSARGHMRGVVEAMAAGDTELAKDRLAHLRDFAQHMQNKVAAINIHFETKNGKKTDKIGYMALQQDRSWREVDSGHRLSISPKAKGDVLFARGVHLDARTVTDYANALSKAYPQLGFKPMKSTFLNSQLLKGSVDQVNQTFTQREKDGKPQFEHTQQAPQEAAESARNEPASAVDAEPVAPEGKSQGQEPKAPEAKVQTKSEDVRESSSNAKASTDEKVPAQPVENTTETSNAGPKQTEQPSKSAEKQGSSEAATPVADRKVATPEEATPPVGGDLEATTIEGRFGHLLGGLKGPGLSSHAAADSKNAAIGEENTNWFVKGFTFPSTIRSRLLNKAEPFVAVLQALTSKKNLEEFTGRKLPTTVSPLVADTFSKLIKITSQRVSDAMDSAVTEALKELKKKGYASPFASKGETNPFNTYNNGKLLNLLEVGPDGKPQLNTNLKQGAILAGLHWLINSAQSKKVYDEEELGELLGIDPSEAAAHLTWFNGGLSRTDGIRGLTAVIERFWGVKVRKDVPVGLSRGISEAMAKQVLQAFEKSGLIEEDKTPLKIRSLDENGNDKFTNYSRIKTNLDTRITKAINSFPDLLDHIVSVEPEPTNYIGEVPTKISKFQTGTGDMVQISKQQSETIENNQKIAYNSEKNTVAAVLKMGKDAAVKLFGHELHDNMNLKHRESLESVNLTVQGAFDYIEGLNAQVEAYAKEHGVDSTEVPVHYDFRVSKVNRLHMQGAYNPQSNKLVRMMVLPTKTNLNLTNADHIKLFKLAVAQHIGLKVHRLGVDQSVSKLSEKLAEPKMAKALSIFTDWAKNQSKPLSLSEDDITTLRDTFGGPVPPEAFHALMDYARLMQDPQSKNFETSLYLEADGVTDGPINSMFHLASGSFTARWVQMIAKGGLFLFPGFKTLADYVTKHKDGGRDLYQVASDLTAVSLRNILQDWKRDKKTQQMRRAMLFAMGELLNGDLKFDLKTNDLTIERGLAKNPLTVTVYGSGEKGIASKIAGEMIDSLYAQMSEGKVNQRTLDALWLLSDNTSVIHQGGEFTKTADVRDTNPIQVSKTFKITDHQFNNIRDNIKTLFVGELVKSIDDTMADVDAGRNLIRDTVQAQSIFLEAAVRDARAKLLDGKMKADPTYKAWMGLTPEEEDKLHRDMVEKYHGIIKSPNLSYYPASNTNADMSANSTDDITDAKQKRTKKEPITISKTLNDKMGTYHQVAGPGNAGVRGIPFGVISGDGQMIQNSFTGFHSVTGMPVFDGINMPVDQSQDSSRYINEGVFKGWTAYDPLTATAQAFRGFVEAVQKDGIPAFSIAQQEALSKLLDVSPDAESLTKALELKLKRIELIALQNRARKNVIEKLNLSVDHMASAEGPFTREDGTQLVGSEAEMLDQINELYQAEVQKLMPKADAEPTKEAQPTEDLSSELLGMGAPDERSKAWVIEPEELSKLTATLRPEIADLFRDIIKVFQGKIIVGSGKSLIRYQRIANAGKMTHDRSQEVNKFRETDDTAILDGRAKADLGYFDIINGNIYLNADEFDGLTAENIVHELIHAATLAKSWYYFHDQSQLQQHEIVAFDRISKLMDEWNAIYDSKIDVLSMSSKEFQLYDHLRNVMQKEAVHDKSSALNEFMAYVLSNPDLTRIAKKKTLSDKLALILQKAYALIKHIVFGKSTLTKPEQDLFSNLKFNTQLLIPGVVSHSELMLQTSSHTSPQFGDNERLENLRRQAALKMSGIVDEAKRNADTPAAKSAASDAARDKIRIADQEAYTLTEQFNANGFSMSPQENSTFKMLTAMFMTEARLDPNALVRMQTIYNHVIGKLSVEDFMDDAEANDMFDRKQANDKFNLVTGKTYLGKDAQGRSTLLPVFMALSNTNDQFREILSKMETPKPLQDDGETVDAYLTNAGMRGMDAVEAWAGGDSVKSSTVQASMDALTDRLMEIASDDKTFIAAIGDGVDRINEFAANALQQGSAKATEKLSELADRTDSKYAKTGLKLLSTVTALANETSSALVAEGALDFVNKTKMWKSMSELVAEFIGRTESNAKVYDMIKFVRSTITRMRQEFRDHLPRVMASKFTRELTPEEWDHLHQTLLNTDLAALRERFSINEIMDMMQDPTKVQAAIAKLEAEVLKVQPQDGALMFQKAKELAEWMNTRKVPGHFLRNAHAIANLNGLQRPSMGKSKRRPNAAPGSLVQLIDHLTSLYALDGADATAKESLALLSRTERDGVDFAYHYLIGQRHDELAKATSTTKAQQNHFKGFVPATRNDDQSIIVANDSEFTRLRLLGYTRAGDYQGSFAERGGPKKGYYYAPASGKTMFHQGIMQNVRMSAYGVDPMTGYAIGMATAGRITEAQEVRQVYQRMSSNNSSPEPLMPIFDHGGDVIAYERSFDPTQEVKVLKPAHLGETLGQWRGRQVEESAAHEVNRELVGHLAKMYDDATNKDAFVNILDLQEHKDPVISDAAKLITPATRGLIDNNFPEGEFWVRRDLVNNAIGYRGASIGDPWTGVTRIDPEVASGIIRVATGLFGVDAYKYLRTGEKWLQAAVSDAKSTIVIKSIIVPASNMVANMYQLASRGVPLKAIIAGVPKKAVEIEAYVKGSLRLQKIEAELRAVKGSVIKAQKLEAEKQAILDAHKRLSIWPLIEAGEFSAISDVGMSKDDIELVEGRLTSYIRKAISKLPEGMNTVARYGMITHDTALFRALEKATEYGDFIGKAILYDDLVKRQKKTDAYAKSRVTEEFVNYDYLPGRTRSYLESMGLAWFWNFKIRSTKVALSILRNNPLHFLLATMAPQPTWLGSIGNPVTDNMLGVMANGNLGYSVGPGMGFHAHALNPWINLID